MSEQTLPSLVLRRRKPPGAEKHEHNGLRTPTLCPGFFFGSETRSGSGFPHQTLKKPDMIGPAVQPDMFVGGVRTVPWRAQTVKGWSEGRGKVAITAAAHEFSTDLEVQLAGNRL